MIVPHFSKSSILSSSGVTATKKPSCFYIHVLNKLFLTESETTMAGFHSTEKAPRTQGSKPNSRLKRYYVN